MNNPTLVVMAAGMGTRYGGVPGLKQVDPVGPNNEIIIDYSIYDAIRAGFEKVVFIIKREMEDAFRLSIGSRISGKIDTAYAFQELDDLPRGYTVPQGRVKPWGTAHAVMAARHAVDQPFAVINADDFYGTDTFTVLADYLKNVDPDSRDFAMAGFNIENTISEHGSVSRGICITEDGYMTGVTERRGIVKYDGRIVYQDGGNMFPIGNGTVVSMNTWAMTPVFFSDLLTLMPHVLDTMEDRMTGEYFLPYAVNTLIEKGMATVRVLKTDERWYGVTYKEDKPFVVSAIASMIENGKYPEKLWS